MKRHIIQFALIFLMSLAVVSAQNVSAGVSIAGGNSSFFFAIGDYYRVPESRVVYIRDHYHFPEEELPVVFFLASRARVEPKVIIDLRIGRRMSWLDIAFRYGMTPEIFYVPLTRVGPPYGNAYGHYKKHKRDYKKVVLLDADVVNLVNLRFMSEYHHIAPELIMDRRGKGEKFVVMNNHFREEKLKGRDGKDYRRNGNNRHEPERSTFRDIDSKNRDGKNQSKQGNDKKTNSGEKVPKNRG